MELQRIRQALDSYVRPDTFPVAIRMVGSTGEIPEKGRMPKRDLGTPMPVCQGIALARRRIDARSSGLTLEVKPNGDKQTA